MCFTISVTTDKTKQAIINYLNSNQGVQMHFNFDDFGEKHLVSGFAHPELPIVKQGSIELGEWGLVPSFIVREEQAKDIQNKTLNARSDTIYERKSYKDAIVKQRCVLVIDGFFEWKHTPSEKIPYYIYPTDGTVFYLGCIYNSWVDKGTGEMKDTFSIITTDANPLMEIIHNSKKRMPLILNKNDIAMWIDPESSHENVNRLMKAYDETKMGSHSISKDASYANRNRNYPEIKDEVEYNLKQKGLF